LELPRVCIASIGQDGRTPVGSLPILALPALGVVFGDIGTSPRYIFKVMLMLAGGGPDPGVILGTCWLVIWTLIVVTTIKYVSFAMRVDNYGEGDPRAHGAYWQQ
jgi:KUP system potassium uptake protein